jgi:hypothetical protein
MRHKPIDTHHTPKPAAITATKRTNNDQRMPEVEVEATRQRHTEAPENKPHN